MTSGTQEYLDRKFCRDACIWGLALGVGFALMGLAVGAWLIVALLGGFVWAVLPFVTLTVHRNYSMWCTRKDVGYLLEILIGSSSFAAVVSTRLLGGASLAVILFGLAAGAFTAVIVAKIFLVGVPSSASS